MNLLKILEMRNKYDIVGDKITSYSSNLGGGSINYWDGRMKTFDPSSPVSRNDLSIKILRNNELEVQHLNSYSWRPDRIFSQYISHERTYIEEKKTIYRDTFLSKISTWYEKYEEKEEINLEVVIEGQIDKKAKIRLEGNLVHIYEDSTKVHKIVSISRKCKIKIEGNKYIIRFPLKLSNSTIQKEPGRENFYIAFAIGENYEEALKNLKDALSKPENFFEKRKREWEKFFEKNVPYFECDKKIYEKMYYFAFYVAKSNIYNFKDGYFKYPFTCPSKFRLLPQWFWDSAFHSIYEKWLNNLPIPKSSIRNILNAQSKDGHLPFTLAKDEIITGKLIQPFILPISIWDIYLKEGDKKFLKETIYPLIKFDKWMMKNRDPKGENLVHLEYPGESGWDNSKRYILNSPFVQSNSPIVRKKRYIQSPDFNTYLYLGRLIISKMAREIGKKEVEKEYEEKAKLTANGIKGMWNEKLGLFVDRFEDNHEPIILKTPGGMIPMFAGLVNKNQARKIISHLLNRNEFWTKYPIPTLSKDDTDYLGNLDEYQSYWNGRVWPNINWLIIESLFRYGYDKEAKELSQKSLEMCVATGEPNCNENYNPETGFPYFAHDIFNYGWGGIFNDILIRRILGIQPHASENRLYLQPNFPDDWNYAKMEGIKVGNHKITVEIRRKGKNIKLKLQHNGVIPLEVISSGVRKQIKNGSMTIEFKRKKLPHWLTY